MCVCVCVCVCACLLSCVWLFLTLWTVVHQAPLSMGFPRQEYWSGFPFLPPGDLPNAGIEPESPASPVLAGRFFATLEAQELSTVGQKVCSGFSVTSNRKTWMNFLASPIPKRDFQLLEFSWNIYSAIDQLPFVLLEGYFRAPFTLTTVWRNIQKPKRLSSRVVFLFHQAPFLGEEGRDYKSQTPWIFESPLYHLGKCHVSVTGLSYL